MLNEKTGFFWGRGVFIVVDVHDSCFKENCIDIRKV